MDDEPRLPVELERKIFELTAEMHSDRIVTLLLVAQRVFLWIEPFLYRAVRMNGTGRGQLLLAARETKPAVFFAVAVRSLFFDSGAESEYSFEDARELLKLCTGVTNFATIGVYSNPQMLPILATMHVQRFAGCLENLFGTIQDIDLTHPFFDHITHIDIFDDLRLKGAEERICSRLRVLPSLTHLCLNNRVPVHVIENVLIDCPRLEVLFLMSTLYDHTPVRDERLVLGDMPTSYWRDWEAGAAGREYFWTRADEFTERKRNGEIAASRFHLERETD